MAGWAEEYSARIFPDCNRYVSTDYDSLAADVAAANDARSGRKNNEHRTRQNRSHNNREARRLELLKMELAFIHEFGGNGLDALKGYAGLRACVKDPIQWDEDLTVARPGIRCAFSKAGSRRALTCGDTRTRHRDTAFESGAGACKACGNCPQFIWNEFVAA